MAFFEDGMFCFCLLALPFVIMATSPPPTTLGITLSPIEVKCSESETRFMYTPCDEDGNRWKVQVPINENCSIENPSAPEPGIKCSFSCLPGQFLDITSQECQKCPEGMFSVGDGKRYAVWNEFPKEFDTFGYDADYRDKKQDKENPCLKATWVAQGDYIESNGSFCRSLLTYSAELPKPGKITFSAKGGDGSAYFHIWVKNSFCNEDNHRYSEDTDQYVELTEDWQTFSLSLEKGHNTVNFVAANFAQFFQDANNGNPYESNGDKTVMINEVVVTGFPYSEQCDRCEPGTFSGPGSSSCEECGPNTFSKGGSGVCQQCAGNEYSMHGSSSCQKRLPCKKTDYFEDWEDCKDGQTQKIFSWIEPKICDSSTKDSVVLPAKSSKISCPPCNPGFFNNGTGCKACRVGTFSDGHSACSKCPPQTRSFVGLFYRFWTRFPGQGIHLFCVTSFEEMQGCRTEKGWTIHDSYISSGIGHSDDAELVMYITVPGFTEDQSLFTMVFDIICVDNNCRMLFQEVNSGRTIEPIKTYRGTQKKTKFVHKHNSRKRIKYRIVFQKKYDSEEQTFNSQMSRLNIYSIDITNAINGGAEKCEPCTAGRDCISCDAGSYIEGDVCVKCPKNTYLPLLTKPIERSKEACLPCPPGQLSEAGSTSCHSNCMFTVEDDDIIREYNFTSLAGPKLVFGPKMFTTKGYPYRHAYNISLCGEKYVSSACVDNATASRHKHDDDDDDVTIGVIGQICRSTMIPDEDRTISAQSISIGEFLNEIRVERQMHNENKTELLESSRNDKISFYFKSLRFTEVCSNGSSGVVHLVCDAKETSNNAISIGSSECPQETCDGCTFEYTWKTMYACPTCSEYDYESIATACVNGKKNIHYVWKEPHVCYGGVEKPDDTQSECSILEKSILDFKLIIASFLLGAILLAVLVVVMCYRNRSLTYKYNRLIDVTAVKDGEFPESEKCALEDGEEDDEIVISRRKGGSKFLDRIKGLRKNKTQFTEFETINLDSMKIASDDDDEI